MVYGQCVVAYPDLYSSRDGKLVCMDFRPEAVFRPGFHDGRGFFGSKESLVAEHVHKFGEPFGGHCRNHLRADKSDVFRLPSPVCPAYVMGAQEGGLYDDWHVFFYPPYDTEHLQLVFGRKAVAALDFEGPCPHAHDLADPFHRLAVEFVLGGVVEQVRRVEYPASTPCNFFVGQTVYLVEEFSVTASCIDYMRMRVAERREHEASPGIDDSVEGVFIRHFLRRSVACNFPVFDCQVCVFKGTDGIHGGSLFA